MEFKHRGYIRTYVQYVNSCNIYGIARPCYVLSMHDAKFQLTHITRMESSQYARVTKPTWQIIELWHDYRLMNYVVYMPRKVYYMYIFLPLYVHIEENGHLKESWNRSQFPHHSWNRLPSRSGFPWKCIFIIIYDCKSTTNYKCAVWRVCPCHGVVMG